MSTATQKISQALKVCSVTGADNKVAHYRVLNRQTEELIGCLTKVDGKWRRVRADGTMFETSWTSLTEAQVVMADSAMKSWHYEDRLSDAALKKIDLALEAYLKSQRGMEAEDILANALDATGLTPDEVESLMEMICK